MTAEVDPVAENGTQKCYNTDNSDIEVPDWRIFPVKFTWQVLCAMFYH